MNDAQQFAIALFGAVCVLVTGAIVWVIAYEMGMDSAYKRIAKRKADEEEERLRIDIINVIREKEGKPPIPKMPPARNTIG